MANILSAILLLVRNLPTILAIAKEVLALLKDYKNSNQVTKADLKQMEKEILDALAIALHDQDQAKLEEVIKSPRAGKPSGYDFVERRSSLPGVVQTKTDKK
jgi:hypothetical protein